MLRQTGIFHQSASLDSNRVAYLQVDFPDRTVEEYNQRRNLLHLCNSLRLGWLIDPEQIVVLELAPSVQSHGLFYPL